jgi:outer membrane protein OmpA-like peptidoglycan-associated protein
MGIGLLFCFLYSEPEEKPLPLQQEKKADKPKTPSLKTDKKKKSLTLQDLQQQLESLPLFASALPEGGAFPHLYIEASGRIKEALRIQKNNPGNKELPYYIRSCSLLVEAAKLQQQILINQENIENIQEEKDSILAEITKTYQRINQIERGYASNLKQDLEEERRKALERQENARKRFQALQSNFIKVRKDARGIILSMSDILFDINKATLTSELKTNLAKIAGILFVYKQAHVIVEGHTDNTGSADYNQKLSEKRAQNVMSFLIEQGVLEERLTSVGYGLTKPVADNSTEEGRQKNRRVDLVISEPKQKQ